MQGLRIIIFQANSDDYFTYRSILQIQNNLQNKTCGVNTPLANTPPTIGILNNYTIPAGTPFVLEGTGSDAETNDAVTYTWEQNNTGKLQQLRVPIVMLLQLKEWGLHSGLIRLFQL